MESFGVSWPPRNEGIIYRDVLPSTFSTSSVLDFYCTKYNCSAPREGWQQRIQNGQITVDGEVVKAFDTTLRAGNCLTYHRLPWTEPPAPWRLQILYEDDHLLAVNKPSGLQVLPGGLYQQRTVLTQLMWRCQAAAANVSTLDYPCISQPSPVHRLGRGTSGVLLCAKTKAAKSKLSLDLAMGASSEPFSFAEKRIMKIYRALVSGIIDTDETFIKEPIGTIKYPGVLKGLYAATPRGKPSQSKVVVLQRDLRNNRSLVQVEIFSGRPHQIRIHLAYLGHPLISDPLYVSGGKPEMSSLALLEESQQSEVNHDDGGYLKPANPVPGDCGYHLHAHKLMLIHPITEKPLNIVAPCPPTLCMPGEEFAVEC
ncbi:hypothetical protein GOP47_0016242 [Adiantum capillus-veneris]|uniref:Pseudouridine synthase RsuA/RluA-like domain-containing protein n=1 Tax=Adiantum capillus-veneris TaxID=13818 RepID=A0A9D4ZBK2_ADICA|nr:hypothetical protein GOP47_0016242 [Adiantum capillus-veneris]